MSDENKNSLILPKSTRSSLEVKTGDWRTIRPEFISKNSACQTNCPIGNQIRKWLSLVKDGKLEEAWRVLIETNPLPAVLGRVCPRFCESGCLRKDFDEALAINSLEGLLGELSLKKGWRPKESFKYVGEMKKVGIIGAGPAGLACAYQLRRKGNMVTIFEAENFPGGMLYWGIPVYRLSKRLLFEEIENNILSLGKINMKCGIKVLPIEFKNFSLRYNAVVVATGRIKSRKLNILGEEDRNVISGLDFLKEINLGRKINLGKIVAVVGGGNTAIDAARVAKKNGAENVFIFYRRRKEDMPALKSEIVAAEKEGIKLITLATPTEIKRVDVSVLNIKYADIELGDFDETGRPKPKICKDKINSCFVNNLIVAIGEDSDFNFSLPYEESLPGNVFFAGDAIKESGGTVAAAINSGNKTAEEVDYYLKNSRYIKEKEKPKEKTVLSPDINSAYFRRCKRFFKKSEGEKSATKEAERCFSCGFCNSCGNCWIFCPDVAVVEKDGKYEINYDYCKGCGICANECPRNVINMELEVKS